MISSFKSDKGTSRENNQDYVDTLVKENGDSIYILCDGMGGYKGGEVASYICCNYIKNAFVNKEFVDVESSKQWLYETIIETNQMVREEASKDFSLSQMGTTLLCLLVTSKFKLFASIGDSRIYSYNNKDLIQLSEDQTFANALLKAGYINQKEAEIHPKKNVLLCAIGSNNEDLDIQIRELEEKNTNYLLCSDGLYNMVDDKEIMKIINNKEISVDEKVNILINAANNNGGKDNISVILVEESL